MQNKSLNILDILKYKSATFRVQPPELKSDVGQSQLQSVCSRQKSSQPQDRISRNLYPADGTRVNQRMESVATRIQLPELESAVE